jgi:hypothetical protein
MEKKVPEWLNEKVRSTLKARFPNVPDSAFDNALEDQAKLLEKSNSIVYCSDCGIIFYLGYNTSDLIMNNKQFLDFKMLSFRHAWDTKHIVKISLEYFKQKIPGLGKIFSLNHFLPMFDENNEINYSKVVEDKRKSMVGTKFVKHTHDENWDAGSVCFCSVCKKPYSNPKEACYCCFGQKPWMPYNVVDTIKVKEF